MNSNYLKRVIKRPFFYIILIIYIDSTYNIWVWNPYFDPSGCLSLFTTPLLLFLPLQSTRSQNPPWSSGIKSCTHSSVYRLLVSTPTLNLGPGEGCVTFICNPQPKSSVCTSGLLVTVCHNSLILKSSDIVLSPGCPSLSSLCLWHMFVR